jgi:phytanoyl-CoA hydroxylase
MSTSATSKPPSQAPGAIPPAESPYPPDLYVATDLARPVQGLEAVTEEHLAQYRRDGFLAVEGAFTASECEAARAALSDLILGRVPGFTCIQFEPRAEAQLDQLTLAQRELAVRKIMDFTRFEPRLRAISEHPSLQPLLQRLLGDQPKMFQDMALVKPPQGREKPWHQDHAYFDYPLGTPIVGVWIALDHATVANGCMHVLPGRHTAGPVVHFKRRDWQICDRDIAGQRCTAVPLAPGGLLFFDGLLPHGTPDNHSSERRRALQFHYAPASAQKAADATDRLAIFGSEGKDVSC